MVTPIRALSINDICKRENDLLVSKDDIKELAKVVRGRAIDDVLEILKKHDVPFDADANSEILHLKDGGVNA